MSATATPLLESPDAVSRRDFLRVGGLGALGLSAAEHRALAQSQGKGARRCIFLFLNGGPSHIDTFDPKPNATPEIRGPFRPISTAVTGVQFAETLPHLAERAQKFVVLRSLFHDAAPIHETGQQLLQTGRLATGDVAPPSLGSIVFRLLGQRNRFPAYAILPRPLQFTGVNVWQGQRAGSLGDDFNPREVNFPETDRLPGSDRNNRGPESERKNGSANVMEKPPKKTGSGKLTRFDLALQWDAEPDHCLESYGTTDFGRACLTARRLVEQGTRFVTVNMFDRLVDRITWDCHANAPHSPTTLADYRDTVCPNFDRAVSALLDDLDQRGLLKETLVVAAGEFGRTPRINNRGGRDHWPSVWSALVAGAGIEGGRVIGASDSRGYFPADRPVALPELAATILHTLGIDLTTKLALPGAEISLADAAPLVELVT